MFLLTKLRKKMKGNLSLTEGEGEAIRRGGQPKKENGFLVREVGTDRESEHLDRGECLGEGQRLWKSQLSTESAEKMGEKGIPAGLAKKKRKGHEYRSKATRGRHCAVQVLN